MVEIALHLGAQRLAYLADCGRPAEALAECEVLAARLEAAGAVALIELLSVQLRVRAERGDATPATEGHHLVTRARGTGEVQQLAAALPSAAQLFLACGSHDDARAVLAELVQTPGLSGDSHYIARLSQLVRCSLALGDAVLAARFVDGVGSGMPLHEHALCAARAQLAEAGGDHAGAVPLDADAAGRWEGFGDVPEHAYALLGHGRCLTGLSEPEAEASLRAARDLFSALEYRSALSETETLLGLDEAAAV